MSKGISKAEAVKRGLFNTRELTADNTEVVDGRLAEREPQARRNADKGNRRKDRNGGRA